MADSNANIRVYSKAHDDKLVRFMIGKSRMDPLATANFKASVHPLAITVWISAAAIFVQYMGWWPNAEHGILGYLSPLPAFAVWALPIVFLIDWLNRPFFESETRKTLARADVADTETYYKRSPVSGFWLLEYDDKFVGLIAVDASLDSQSDDTLKENAEQRTARAVMAPGTSNVAVIRHFFVNETYRPTSIQSDLLDFAVKHTFSTGTTVEKIECMAVALTPYVGHALRKGGFKVVGKGRKMGVLGWTPVKYELTREEWTKRQ